MNELVALFEHVLKRPDYCRRMYWSKDSKVRKGCNQVPDFLRGLNHVSEPSAFFLILKNHNHEVLWRMLKL